MHTIAAHNHRTAGMATTRLQPTLPVPLVTNLPGPELQNSLHRGLSCQNSPTVAEPQHGDEKEKERGNTKEKFSTICASFASNPVLLRQYKEHLFCPAKDSNKDHWLKEMKHKFGKKRIRSSFSGIHEIIVYMLNLFILFIFFI